ncbi:small integral membrane protein 20-like [Mizuhopecten yessoensis]|uniref:Small integral membrane protein 20 n=1 Tax=Mizuhopecten yessoensis TaxID=6573 RepID=A0A210Q3M1_MIZYE|nr:small integral membrane protein 20-like [Mizuhopecten yessoensis]OWF43343.1 hypothetical protein KP79_PYT12657 [Mizuhopecten yessoensis]
MPGPSKFQKKNYKRLRQHQMIGWKYAAFVGGIVGAIGLALYPIAIQPMIDPTKWQEIQKEARAGYDVEKIQPGEMRVWTNPMKSKSEKE